MCAGAQALGHTLRGEEKTSNVLPIVFCLTPLRQGLPLVLEKASDYRGLQLSYLLPWVSETLLFKTVLRLEDHSDFKCWTKWILHYDRVMRARE